MNTLCRIQWLGRRDYETTWHAMKEFTKTRDDNTVDEIWIVEHPPVFTFGQAGRREHLLQETTIPIVKSDRGGQITYHGPGQLIIYLLIDLKRKQFGIRRLVTLIENSVIDCLQHDGIHAESRPDAPGVYVDNAKICSIGLRVSQGCTFHGLAFNVAMDLSPFQLIDPCGFKGMQVTQLADFIPGITLEKATPQLLGCLLKNLGYNTPNSANAG